MKRFFCIISAIALMVVIWQSYYVLAEENEPLSHAQFAQMLDDAFGFEFDADNMGAQLLRGEMAVMVVDALGYSFLAAQVERFGYLPFSDVDSHKGYIIIAYDIGMVNGIGDGLFAPYRAATQKEAAYVIARVYDRLNAPLDWVHGFYAFASFHQRYLIKDMDTVSFGWGRMEWSAETGAWLNTGRTGNNHWAIPNGYELIADFPREHGTATHLNVFMDTTMGLYYLISGEEYRTQAVNALLYEATRVYEAIGRSPFDGITINFEGLRGESAKANFTAFLTELEEKLRANDLNLYVTVHPATIDGIYFDGYDLRKIGQLADRVILMAHDYHPRSLEGFLGTQWQRNAAITPIAEVYRALTAITHPYTGVKDLSRVAIAFNFANIGWFVDEYNRAIYPTPISVTTERTLERMAQPSTYFGWCDTFRNPYIIYTTEYDQRVFLWFENDRSVYEKLKLARLFGITGASIWRLGMIPNDYVWDVWGNFSPQTLHIEF